MTRSWWSRLANPPDYLTMPAAGLDLSDRSLKVMVLKKHNNRIVIREHSEKEIPIGIIERGAVIDRERLVKFLQETKQELNLKRVVISLPEEQSFVFRLNLPWMRRRELREAVELQLEENVPLKTDEVVFDYEIFKKPANRSDQYHLAISVLPAKFVETYLDAFEAAGFELSALELEAQAVARALIKKDSNGAHILVDIGRTHTGFAVTVGQTVLFTSATDAISGDGFTRNVEKQLGIDFAAAEALKINQGLRNPHGQPDVPMALMTMAAALRDEINKIIYYWRAHETEEVASRPLKIILSGGQSSLPGLKDYLETSLGLPVSVPDPWGNILTLETELPPVEYRLSLGLATVVGLALRGVETCDD